MSKKLLLFSPFLLTAACDRQDITEQTTNCVTNTIAPVVCYTTSDFVPLNYTEPVCGYLPLNKRNYWVYLDSTFDNNGHFVSAAIDTLRFDKTYQTPDGLVWWGSTPHGKGAFKGYHNYLYVTDSTIYSTGANWCGYPSVKWIYAIPTDSTNEDCRYTDHTTVCIAKKIPGNITVPAGNFSNCMFYYKKWVYGGYNIDIWFKPGVGCLRSRFYMNEHEPPHSTLKTSTLLSYHLE